MNDLYAITEVGQQRSIMTKLIIITAARFLASKNTNELVILELGDLDHQTGSFSPIVYAHAGQLIGATCSQIPMLPYYRKLCFNIQLLVHEFLHYRAKNYKIPEIACLIFI